MTYQQFVDEWNNKPCDYDHYYGNQCMDLANQYNQDVIGAPRLAGNAKDVWDAYPRDQYDHVANSPDGVPQKGDIVIWGTGVGAYGHIAIFDHGDANSFTSFDQNWPVNSFCHFQSHNYNGVLGWLHPKSAVIAQPIAQAVAIGFQDNTIIPVNVITAKESYGEIELQVIRSKFISKDQDLQAKDNQIQELDKQVEDTKNLLADTLDRPKLTIEQALDLATKTQLFNAFVKKFSP